MTTIIRSSQDRSNKPFKQPIRPTSKSKALPIVVHKPDYGKKVLRQLGRVANINSK
jgi:hypothetical protein